MTLRRNHSQERTQEGNRLMRKWSSQTVLKKTHVSMTKSIPTKSWVNSTSMKSICQIGMMLGMRLVWKTDCKTSWTTLNAFSLRGNVTCISLNRSLQMRQRKRKMLISSKMRMLRQNSEKSKRPKKTRDFRKEEEKHMWDQVTKWMQSICTF